MTSFAARVVYALYTALLRLAVVLVALPLAPLLRLVSRRVREGARDLLARPGGELRSFTRTEGGLLWLHGVSVGEVNAMRPLLVGLRAAGYRKFYITSTCPEGVRRARELNERGDLLAGYAPLDLPGFVARLLDELNPAAIVVLEVDLWPNLARIAAHRGVPLFLVNARVSAKTARFYGLLPSFSAALFGAVTRAYAQTDGDAERLAALGLPRERILPAGNLKFDIKAPEEVRPATLERFLLGVARTDTLASLLAGSTHPGEERMLLDAARILLETGAIRREDLFLVIAPRDTRRTDEILRLGGTYGFNGAAWSDASSRGLVFPHLLVVDRFGVLPELYRLCRVAYIGGSLPPASVGGHNLLEAAAAGCPILHGPDMRNFREQAEDLNATGAAFAVRDAAACATRIAALLADTVERERIAEHLRAFHGRNRGAAERILADLIPRILPKSPE